MKENEENFAALSLEIFGDSTARICRNNGAEFRLEREAQTEAPSSTSTDSEKWTSGDLTTRHGANSLRV